MKKKNNAWICFVAGKTGGHLLPALTLADDYLSRNPENSVLFFCTTSKLDKEMIQQKERLHVIYLPLSNAPSSIVRLPFFAFQSLFAFFSAFIWLLKKKPSRIVSTGGFIGVPVGIAGFLLRIPLELFELNVIPGKAVKFLAPLAKTIVVCFEKTKELLSSYNCVVQPYPLRSSLVNSTAIQSSKTKKVLFIMGGSQGSLFLNNLIPDWLETISDHIKKNIIIVHQTGNQELQHWQDYYKQHTIDAQVFSFNHDIALLYQQSDLIICRAGAGTLFEINHFKKRCITIPLVTKTTDHQLYNAQEMAKQNSLIHCVQQEDIIKNKQLFFNQINTYLFLQS